MNAPHLPAAERVILQELFDEAIRAVDPMAMVRRYLPNPLPGTRVLVLGAGKASARMARAVEHAWSDRPDLELGGLVVTRYGHGDLTRHIEIVEAGHPVPDANGRAAAERLLALARTARPGDLVVCLISGGGSSLLSLPRPGLEFQRKQAIHRSLLTSGATISEMNCVRRHLSAVKGGRLAEACGEARVVTLVVSDVPGDDPAIVASGPTIADGSRPEDAVAILRRYQIDVPDVLREDTRTVPLPRDGAHSIHVIASAQDALEAAAARARIHGLTPLILGGSLEGEARDMASVHAGIARQIRRHGQPVRMPAVILSGGEATVTVRGDGRGGRNAEFLLALAMASQDLPGLHAIACDTDGIDGVEDNAGAFIDPKTMTRAASAGLDARAYLARNDAWGFFSKLDQLVVTGPTRTNVNDFRAILVA